MDEFNNTQNQSASYCKSNLNANQAQPQQIAPKKKTRTTGIKIAAIVCIAMFFFPLFTVSCSAYGETLSESLSGWDCTLGVELFDGEGKVEAHPLNSLLLIIPGALLAIAMFLRSRVNPAAILLGIAQVVALLIFRSAVIEYIEAEAMSMLDVSFTAWYTIDILSAIAAAILGAIGLFNISLGMNKNQLG